MAVQVCVDVYAGAGPWVWVEQGIVWLDDMLLEAVPCSLSTRRTSRA